MINTQQTGKPISRVDGKAKVTGTAKYAGEFHVEGLLYGFVVSSPIARGKITSIDTKKAMDIQGVVQVYTHKNVSGLPWFDRSYKDSDAPSGSPYRPLYDNEIQFSMQPIALVVAETYELARYGASLISFEFDIEEPETDIKKNLEKSKKAGKEKQGFNKPKSRGKYTQAFRKSEVQFEGEYFHGAEHHNPMEMHASTVIYEKGGHLTVYDKTQGVLNSQSYITKVFGLSKKKVHVKSPFVGGAFGSGLRPQYQLFMAVLAALELKASVRVVLTRQQMFSFGHRPVALQQMGIAANNEGKLNAIKHVVYSETSKFENYVENIVYWSGILYQCENVAEDHRLVPLDMYTPLDMRAPGAATGVFALECAMDELSYKLSIDPLELRIKNYTEKDPSTGHPFSSKALMDCYHQAATKFGWSKRNPQPRSMKEGHQLVGWGMATGIWDAMHMPARAHAILDNEGKLTVMNATADIGTGTYTIMTQIAAETLGLPLEDVSFKLGDSDYPYAYLEGGSSTAASVGTAVFNVCNDIKKKLFKLLGKADVPGLKDVEIEEILFAEGSLCLKANTGIRISIKELMKQSGEEKIEEKTIDLPNMLRQKNYARNTHSAVFAEVKVDESLGTITVTRVVSAIAAGRILNTKTARSQIMGGIVWGISQALQEDSFMDHNLGRFMNHNLSEYHVPVNADIHEIDVIFVEEKDDIVSPIGVKGVGEIGLVGVASAIANAIYHATGKRVRDLPVTLDKLL